MNVLLVIFLVVLVVILLSFLEDILFIVNQILFLKKKYKENPRASKEFKYYFDLCNDVFKSNNIHISYHPYRLKNNRKAILFILSKNSDNFTENKNYFYLLIDDHSCFFYLNPIDQNSYLEFKNINDALEYASKLNFF